MFNNDCSLLRRTPSRKSARAKHILISPATHRQQLNIMQSKILLQDQKRLTEPRISLPSHTKPKSAGRVISIDFSPKPKTSHRSSGHFLRGEMERFKEIFVQPREEKLEELKEKLSHQRVDSLLFDPRNKQSFVNRSNSEIEIRPTEISNAEVVDKSFYNQQIKVQPPEGLNATVAAPLTPGGGWAPSIPGFININKSSLKDLAMRAKAGVQAGDVQREAHMSFCLGVMNEQKLNFKPATKFFKRFFYCARLLDDPVGAALSLNRLGCVYHSLNKHQLSLKFHLKHYEFAERDNMFAAYYNIGISHRSLGNIDESLDYFHKAYDWSASRYDSESECISLGQLGYTYSLTSEPKQAIKYLKVTLI